MNSYNRALLFLIFLFSFFHSSAIFSNPNPEPVISRKVGYLKTQDEPLEKVLRQWSAAKGVKPSDDVHYFYNKVDLNDDGHEDAIVFMAGNPFCGSGGCMMMIFKGDGTTYQLLTQMTVSNPPLIVTSHRTQGWYDLVMPAKGSRGGYYALLSFDGKGYPRNPTVAPALPNNQAIKGVEYLSGIEHYDAGFKLP